MKDFTDDTLTRVSTDSSGIRAAEYQVNEDAQISDDGVYVAFRSSDSKLVDGDNNSSRDIFLKDTRIGGATTRVSVNSLGVEGNSDSLIGSSISADGRHVAFCSTAFNLAEDDTNGPTPDIFLRDTSATDHSTVLVSNVLPDGSPLPETATNLPVLVLIAGLNSRPGLRRAGNGRGDPGVISASTTATCIEARVSDIMVVDTCRTSRL